MSLMSITSRQMTKKMEFLTNYNDANDDEIHVVDVAVAASVTTMMVIMMIGGDDDSIFGELLVI